LIALRSIRYFLVRPDHIRNSLSLDELGGLRIVVDDVCLVKHLEKLRRSILSRIEPISNSVDDT
jgi:hypothetical protein